MEIEIGIAVEKMSIGHDKLDACRSEFPIQFLDGNETR